MENQHRLIPGYRELNQQEITLIAEIKKNGGELGVVLDALVFDPEIDQRSLALARTHLQEGFMWLIRSIAKPEGFC